MSQTSEEDARTRILNAAGQIFAERGFLSATIREICQRAKVNIAAVNYHFGDKEHLYIETVKQAHRLRTTQVPLPRWEEGTPAEVKLRDFVRTLVQRMAVPDMAPWHHQLMMREMAQPTRACTEIVEESIRPELALLRSILRELLPPDFPSCRLHQVAFSVVGQCLFYKVGLPVARVLLSSSEFEETIQPDVIAGHIVAFTLAALGAGPAVGRE